jgi:peptide/nickel transport system permease protein
VTVNTGSEPTAADARQFLESAAVSGAALPLIAAGPPAAPGAVSRPRSGGDGALARARRASAPFLRRPGFLLALVIMGCVLVSAVFPSLFTSQNPDTTQGANKLQPPSAQHWFGTDELGRDLYTRMIYGSGLTIEATLIAVGLAIVAGLVIGVVSGFFGRWIDVVLMRAVDVILAIPALLLALTIVTALGFGEVPVALAVGVGITPGFVRTTRAEVLRVKTLPFIEAARTGGAGWRRVLLRHILPNSWGPVLVLALLDIGTAILVISSLSFLGFGAAPPAADWGGLIFDGSQYLVTSPWLALLPGLFVAVVVFSVNHIARTIQETQP